MAIDVRDLDDAMQVIKVMLWNGYSISVKRLEKEIKTNGEFVREMGTSFLHFYRIEANKDE